MMVPQHVVKRQTSRPNNSNILKHFGIFFLLIIASLATLVITLGHDLLDLLPMVVLATLVIMDMYMYLFNSEPV